MKSDATFEGGSLKSGAKLGSYEILALLGAGGMGEVYQAHDAKLRRDVAIKVLPTAFLHNSERLVRFQREARILAALNHPNIATIYGLEQAEGIQFLVMELVVGQSLVARLEGGPLRIKEVLDIGIQVADALDSAHSQGVIHRDIKPGNIVVSQKGQAKVLDFGLAKFVHFFEEEDSSQGSPITKDRSISQTEALFGTIPYMSPEHVRREPTDGRSDLFSFGLVLYEMATGCQAFKGRSDGVILDAILNCAPVPPLELNRVVPPRLAEIIGRALEKDPGLRYQTARDLKSDLQRLKRDVASGAASGSSAAPPTALTRRHWPSWLRFATAGVTGLALLLFIAMKANSPNPVPTGSYPVTGDGQQKEFPDSFYPVVTDSARLYFTEVGKGDLRFAHVSAAGSETSFVETPFRFPRMADISPDHSQVLVLGFNGSELESSLWTMPILGGPGRRVGGVEAHDATWTPEGNIVYANGSDLYWTRADGSGTRKLISLEGVPFWLRLRPDGQLLRFSLRDPGTDVLSLWEVSVDGTNLHPLLPAWNEPPAECCGNWSPDGKYFAFQSTRNGRSNIWMLQDTEHFWSPKARPKQITAGPMNFLAPVFGGNGENLFVIGEQRRGELLRYDTKTRQFLPYLSGISADRLGFSRDEHSVAYVSYPDGTLWRSKIDGSQKQQLTFLPFTVHLPRWSPDGSRILFDGSKDGKTKKIFVIPSEGGVPIELLPGDQRQTDPSWSADGDSIVFTGSDPKESSGSTTRIFTFNLRTHDASPLPGSQGLLSPRWSPDGRSIAATTIDSQKLLVFDIATRKWNELAQIGVGYLCWSKDSKYLYFDTFGSEPTIARIRIRDRIIEKVADLKDLHRAWGPYGPWFGLAPDDAILATRDIGSQELYGIQWPAPR